MKKAYIFPGQGAQFQGMGKDIFDSSQKAKDLFTKANEILGFDISKIMFEGSAEDLKQTNVTQPAVFLHSVIKYLCSDLPKPDAVAGHSLGEFSALVANDTLDFESALKLVSLRAKAMQKACEIEASTMAAILGLPDEKIEEICNSISDEIVVPANYNCPGQLVISGSLKGIEMACEKMKEAGAKRALVLQVGGAFHSPLMLPAKDELQKAIEETEFKQPICPIYQNVNAKAVSDKDEIKQNLILQLTAPVRWTQIIQEMQHDGISNFLEIGPGNVLSGLVKKINRDAITENMA
ncbi:MAG: ACP S-malonyltransferase [Chitinophagaceae bacterium]|nr:ACP S-malonyltransferase [Chitinophagaceae bacterium]